MSYHTLYSLRNLIKSVEKETPDADRLYEHEAEYLAAPEGISLIVPIHNGGDELEDLLDSLRNQTLGHDKFEVIFALNGCTDDTRKHIDNFNAQSDVRVIVLEDSVASVARARNSALARASFRFATFVDHDDYLSRAYLEECVTLGDFRTVVVSNIIKVEDGYLIEDYAQNVISTGFTGLSVIPPADISLCYRAYTLNAIKSAPTYMLRRVTFDEDLTHCEDVKYWRDVFHAFTPITVKSPTRRDIYFRVARSGSLSRRSQAFHYHSKPRFKIIDQIKADSKKYRCDSPQRKMDAQLEPLLMEYLWHLGRK